MQRVEVGSRKCSTMTDAGVPFVGLFDLLGRQRAAERDGAVERIGVGRAVAGDLAAGLRPACRMARMRVGDAADAGEALVEADVGRRVRRRPQRLARQRLARFQGNQHDVFGPKRVVGDAARLDRDDAALAVDAAGVAPGQHDQPGLRPAAMLAT